ncbi:hypothetical protein DPMN_108249 [Dreissena polymorpha]|uniref:Uncharacterized protein n=1 Tax=Dreissena polymorpha TaxID=45954 RepID=A0A9D4QKS2_DREPO|nr:hypothetical protein DPMN_108249 [Dreissena polymorpha]
MGVLVMSERFACSGWRSSLEIGPPRPPDMQIRLASPRKTAGRERPVVVSPRQTVGKGLPVMA